MKINFHSINTRSYVVFAITSLVFSVLIVYLAVFLKKTQWHVENNIVRYLEATNITSFLQTELNSIAQNIEDGQVPDLGSGVMWLDSLNFYLDEKADREIAYSFRQIVADFKTIDVLFSDNLPEEALFIEADLKIRDLIIDTSNLSRELVAKRIHGREVIYSRIRDFSIWMIAAIILAVVIIYFLRQYLYRQIVKPIGHVNQQLSALSSGDLPEHVHAVKNEFNEIHASTNQLSMELKNILAFANEVGNGKFESQVSVFNNQGALGSALANMRDSLKKVANEEQLRNRINDGLNQLSNLIRQHNNTIESLTRATLFFLIEHVKADQGAFFIKKSDETGQGHLEMTSWYAYKREKIEKRTVLPGEGFVGQCFQEKKPIRRIEIPENYSQLASALGEAPPKSILIFPLINEEELTGVIEFLFDHDFSPEDEQFIEQAADILAGTLISVISNENMRRMVAESQQQTDLLKEQEQMMRQQTEEMMATQEDSKRQIDRELQLRNMYESMMKASGGIYYRSQLDNEFTKLFISRNIMDITGESDTKFISGASSLLRYIDKEHQSRIRTSVNAAVQAKSSYNLEYVIITHEGKKLNIRDIGTVIAEDGKPKYLDGVIFYK